MNLERLGSMDIAYDCFNYKVHMVLFPIIYGKKYQLEKVPIWYFFLRKKYHTPFSTFSHWYFFLYTVSSVIFELNEVSISNFVQVRFQGMTLKIERVKLLQMAGNDSKSTQIVTNSSKLLEMASNGSTQLQIAPNGSE